MFKKILFASALIIGPALVHACKSPDYVVAIFLNNGESVDLSTIDKLGEEGVSYFKSNVTPGAMRYTFRSHYNSSIMISLTAGAITFTIDTSSVGLKDFPFGACTRTELDWMVETGVVSMDRIEREKIEQSFLKCGRGSFNYYTKQDTLMHSSYALSEDGQFLAIDCIGPDDIINLPDKELKIPTGINRDVMKTSSSAINNSNKTIFFDISGRKLGQNRITQPTSSSIMIQYNAASGTIKRTMKNSK